MTFLYFAVYSKYKDFKKFQEFINIAYIQFNNFIEFITLLYTFFSNFFCLTQRIYDLQRIYNITFTCASAIDNFDFDRALDSKKEYPLKSSITFSCVFYNILTFLLHFFVLLIYAPVFILLYLFIFNFIF